MTTRASPGNRLSILYLLCVTAGIAIAITVAGGIEQLRSPADAVYYNQRGLARGEGFSMLVTAVYGVCVTTFVFAWRSGDLWGSPGKTLALLFAMMCVLNWTFDLLAAVVMHYRMQTTLPEGVTDTRGYIVGIWYRDLAPSLGYVAGLPVLALVIYQTRRQPLSWRVVWIGFVVFALLIVAAIHFDARQFLPLSLRSWYFEMAIGIPVVLLTIALCRSLWRREQIDWWTGVTAPLIVSVWGIGVVLKALG